MRYQVGDFGLASLQSQPGDLLCATRVGTRCYQAPEVLAGCGGVYDGGKADAWSLGIVLFILLLGAPPFAKVTEVLRLKLPSHS
jgi:carbon catabolite-derepressing protein kinase